MIVVSVWIALCCPGCAGGWRIVLDGVRRCQKVRRQKCQNFEFGKFLNYVFLLIPVVSHMCQGPGTKKIGA